MTYHYTIFTGKYSLADEPDCEDLYEKCGYWASLNDCDTGSYNKKSFENATDESSAAD